MRVSLLQERQREVARYVQKKGWRDNPVSFGDAMMMLVTEIDEAQRAYMNGDGTSAIAAEFADIMIRLMDDCDLWGVQLASIADSFMTTEGEDAQTGFTFLVNAVVDAVEAYRVHGFIHPANGPRTIGLEIQRCWARLYYRVLAMAEDMEIDLPLAIDLKMALNWERDYRHGGKFL